MAKIISTILISYLGWKLTGYNFFTLSALVTLSIDLYTSLRKLFFKAQKIYNKYTKDDMVDKPIK